MRLHSFPTRRSSDLPGLIEGASTGRGLGDDFLRHIERCKVLVHLISVENLDNFENSYQTVRQELTAWSEKLSKKPEIVVLSKSDLLPPSSIPPLKASPPIITISAETGEGLEGLVGALGEILEETSKVAESGVEKPKRQTASIIYTINNLPNKRVVFKGDLRGGSQAAS